MSIDVWIAIIACVSAIWGVVMTFWAPSTFKKKLLCLVPFVVSAVIGILLVRIQSEQKERAEKANINAQKTLKESVDNSTKDVAKLRQGLMVIKDVISGKDFDREKAALEIQNLLGEGLLQLQDVVLRTEESTFAIGRQIAANVFVGSTGPVPAANAVIFNRAYIVGLDRQQQDNKALKLFEKDLTTTRQQYFSGAMSGQDIAFGHGLFVTTRTTPLTQRDCDQLLNGKANIYFLTWWAWTDASGKKKSGSDCRSLQLAAPGQPYRKPEEVTWHACVKTD
jgi:predicted membrane protein